MPCLVNQYVITLLRHSCGLDAMISQLIESRTSVLVCGKYLVPLSRRDPQAFLLQLVEMIGLVVGVKT